MFKSILKALSVAGLGLGTGVIAADPRPTPAPADGNPIVSPIAGDYSIVSGEEHGQPTPADRLKGAVVAISGNTITGTDQTRKTIFGSTYTLDTKATPWAIRMKSTTPKADEEAMGLVKKEGTTLTIIYALPGGAAPTEFKTKEKQNMFVLKGMTGGFKPKSNKFVTDPVDPTTVPPNATPSGPNSPPIVK